MLSEKLESYELEALLSGGCGGYLCSAFSCKANTSSIALLWGANYNWFKEWKSNIGCTKFGLILFK